MPETLREKVTKKVHGPNANPSQLGDPISMKAEHSDTVPTDDEAGSQSSSSSFWKPPSQTRTERNKNGGEREMLREKAAKKLNGPDANPSMLGDPINLKKRDDAGGPRRIVRKARGMKKRGRRLGGGIRNCEGMLAMIYILNDACVCMIWVKFVCVDG
ncbi:hypothetical protein RRF57_006132 [Xylaria bambusicola]|uniref:Uncharacterized protein n=1 Tax=Xylaria bambusicola TaxID=326684 RepID=A0AAN7UKP9_9PEZI